MISRKYFSLHTVIQNCKKNTCRPYRAHQRVQADNQCFKVYHDHCRSRPSQLIIHIHSLFHPAVFCVMYADEIVYCRFIVGVDWLGFLLRIREILG
jgi:hypothetical protein